MAAMLDLDEIQAEGEKIAAAIRAWGELSPAERARRYGELESQMEALKEEAPQEVLSLIGAIYTGYKRAHINEDVADARRHLLRAAASILAEGDGLTDERLEEILDRSPDPYSEDGRFRFDPEAAHPFDLRSPGPSMEFHPQGRAYDPSKAEDDRLDNGDLVFGR